MSVLRDIAQLKEQVASTEAAIETLSRSVAALQAVAFHPQPQWTAQPAQPTPGPDESEHPGEPGDGPSRGPAGPPSGGVDVEPVSPLSEGGNPPVGQAEEAVRTPPRASSQASAGSNSLMGPPDEAAQTPGASSQPSAGSNRLMGQPDEAAHSPPRASSKPSAGSNRLMGQPDEPLPGSNHLMGQPDTTADVPSDRPSHRSEGTGQPDLTVAAPGSGTPVKSESKDSAGKPDLQKGDRGLEEEPRERVYPLKESIWDVLVLVFMPGSRISALDSFMAIVLYLANITVQVLFTYVIILLAMELKGEMIGETAHSHALAWRIGIGHHVRNYDPVTKSSLVTRVCGDYGAEIVAAGQMDMYKSIDTYLEGQGPLLSWLAIFVWTVGVCSDMREVWEFLSAVISVKRGKTACIYQGDQSYSLESLSMPRTVLLVSATVVRLALACGLWYAGMLWLTYTVTMFDIVLNAVGLGFVFDFDELFYNLVPRDLDHFLQNLEPLPVPQLRRKLEYGRQRPWFSRPDLRSLSLVLLAFVTMATWSITTGNDRTTDLESSRHLFCSGQTNFVYVEDPATSVIKTAVTLSDDEFNEIELSESTPALYRAVLQRTNLRGEAAAQLETVKGLFDPLEGVTEDLFVPESITEVVLTSVRQPSQAIDGVPCEDIDVTEPTRNGMRGTVGYDDCTTLVEMEGCSDWQARSFCPQSCKCADADNGFFNRNGCTSQCDLKYERDISEKRAKFAKETCQDNPASDKLPMFFEELQQHLVQRGDLHEVDGDVAFTEAFRESFRARTNDFWVVQDVKNVSVAWWWHLYKGERTDCNLALYFDAIFETNLCEADLAADFGMLAPFCPQACGWCDDPKPQVEWQTLAHDLTELLGYDVISHSLAAGMPYAVNLDDAVCTRTGAEIHEFIDGTTEGAENRVAGVGLEQIFTFTAQHSGVYSFRVIGENSYDTILSMWSGISFRQLEINDDAPGLSGDQYRDPCFTVDVDGGSPVVLLVEAYSADQAGSFTLVVECPWSSTGEYCPARDDRPDYSMEQAACGSVGRHDVVLAEKCEAAGSRLGLVVTSMITGASYAPVGCSYENYTQTLHINGAGHGGAECGDHFKCICQKDAEDVTFNKFPSACDKAAAGPCKVCVEEFDTYCESNEWDQMCDGLCSLICEPVCEASPFQVVGPCIVTQSTMIEDEVDEWCLTSDNYYGPSSSYSSDTTCNFTLGLKEHERRAYGPLRVDYFFASFNDDTLTVNGQAYAGFTGPVGVVPTSTIAWASGSSVTDLYRYLAGPDSDSYGWRICSNVTREACVDSEGCSDRAKSEWKCGSESLHCCHCGGGNLTG